ncbi:DUF4382 domain-containing protein [Dinghuibacter silviterrae]|uniref:Uncharacterized protein DUF4382 n=1 Tax=Dinghuibacter silviterrae TaxID=1539049 RepID=A0A4R8DFX5_9BACT|nr:DUF4382 domain-containing protein [Dinghuibacter silviterrae]TDW96248.1 uncharacterized protein DUF4382 [Dinghuibacter silviterrae]
MKKTNKLLLFLAPLAAGTLIFAACQKSTSNSATSGSGHLTIHLTDDIAPRPTTAVYIDVESVWVHAAPDSSLNGWVEVPLLRRGIYNLLNFRNGLDTVLAGVDLPSGIISQIRLVLGDSNSFVLNGIPYPLKTPSAQQSGLKFNVHAPMTPGIDYALWIDFMVSQSIVDMGNGTYMLKPVIRTYSKGLGGSIQGFALPSVALPDVWAIQGTDSLLARPDSATGYYFFGGVTAGTWNIYVHPEDSLYKDTTFSVTVADGVVTNADTVTLHK